MNIKNLEIIEKESTEIRNLSFFLEEALLKLVECKLTSGMDVNLAHEAFRWAEPMLALFTVIEGKNDLIVETSQVGYQKNREKSHEPKQ